MNQRPTIIERAYQLARSGTCASVGDIRTELKVERYELIGEHLSGYSIRSELKKLCRQHCPEPAPEQARADEMAHS